MILTLSSELFHGMTDEERPRFWSLVYELSAASVDHALLLENGEDLSQTAAPAWLSAEPQLHQGEVRRLLELGLLIRAQQPAGGPSWSEGRWRRAGPLRVRVERRTASDWPALRLSLADAVAILREPLRLVLENGRNDLGFVKYLSDAGTRELLRRLEDAPAGGLIVAVSGGTGEVKEWLQGHAEADALSDVQLRRLWKTWVMFDMDAGRDDAAAPSEAIEEIMGLCETIAEKHGVPLSWVCLQRREIESYIPDQGLPNRAARRRIKAARAAVDQQRWAWAYDMKRGLVGDLLDSVGEERRRELKRNNPALVPRPGELKRPFDALDDEVRSDLARGFGKKVLNGPLNEPEPPAWLDQLGDEYDRGPVHQLPRASLIQSLLDRV